MSIDKLQDKIRKLKNPSVIDLTATSEQIPPHILEQETGFVNAYSRFCAELLSGLRDKVPAVRFSLNTFSLLVGGLDLLAELTHLARDFGYYVMIDAPISLNAQQSEVTAQRLFSETCPLHFDGLIVCAYIGSDSLRPYVHRLVECRKSLFCVIRSANKSAPELQDLLTGSRHVHLAMADIVSRFAQPHLAKCGYSFVAGVAAATSPASIHTLRSKHKNIFLLLDGYDNPNANAKNCSVAFDKLGHGAAACAGHSVTAAWIAENDTGEDYISLAINAAERMRKNLCRYVEIL